MKNDLFGDKVKYEQFAPPFVLVALLNRFDNRYQSAADAFFQGAELEADVLPEWHHPAYRTPDDQGYGGFYGLCPSECQ